MIRIVPIVVFIAACSKPDAAATPPPLAHASQADLAREIAEAEPGGSWRRVQQRWQGQRVRWQITRRRALCSAAADCNVAAFPEQRATKQGWMPTLVFAAGQYDALAARCGAQDPCDAIIDGTVGALEVSAETPTKLTLSDVRVADAGQRQSGRSAAAGTCSLPTETLAGRSSLPAKR